MDPEGPVQSLVVHGEPDALKDVVGSAVGHHELRVGTPCLQYSREVGMMNRALMAATEASSVVEHKLMLEGLNEYSK